MDTDYIGRDKHIYHTNTPTSWPYGRWIRI